MKLNRFGSLFHSGVKWWLFLVNNCNQITWFSFFSFNGWIILANLCIGMKVWRTQLIVKLTVWIKIYDACQWVSFINARRWTLIRKHSKFSIMRFVFPLEMHCYSDEMCHDAYSGRFCYCSTESFWNSFRWLSLLYSRAERAIDG